MKMHCPQCGVKGSVDDSYIGRRIRCPKCRQEFNCLADEQVLPGDVEQEPIVSPSWESPAPAPVDEIPAAESPTPELEEPAALLADQEQPDRMDESPPALSQALDRPEGSMVAEETEEVSVEEHATEPGPEVVAPELRDEEEPEREDAEAPIAEEAGPVPLEEIPAEPDRGPVSSEEAEQNLAADIGDPGVESKDEQEALKLEAESPSSLPGPAAMVPPPPAPTADEQQPPGAEPQPAPGRFSQGADPRTDFTIGEALNEAWQYTKGAKGSIWAAVGMMYLVMLVLGFGLGFMQGVFGLDPASAAGIWAEIGVQTLISAISTIFTAGLMYIGVRRAAEKSYSWKMIFAGFQMAVKLLIAGILMTLLVISGLFLLVLPGIYLAVGYTMTLPLMLDRQLEPWQAMEASRKAIHQVWWKIFGLFFVMGLLYLVSAIPLGIGLIWTVPMFVILGGVVYRYLFGVQAKKH